MGKRVSVGRRASSIIRYALGFSWMSFWSVLFIFIFLLFLPSRAVRIRIGNIYGKIVGPGVLWLIGMRPKIINRQGLTGPAIFLSNHTSQMDPMIAIWLAPIGGCGVAKKSIANIPFFGWAYRVSGHLLIDRSNREKAIESMAVLCELVKKMGLSVWIWPEGTRSMNGRLLPFKKGFVHMAIATGLPVVPIVVRDGHQRWPPKTFLLYPGEFEIEVLDPIDTSEWNEESIEHHIKTVVNVYNDALPLEQRGSESS